MCVKRGFVCCLNNLTLVKHANKCHGYEKNAITGDLIKSNDDYLRQRTSETSASPALTDLQTMSFELKSKEDFHAETPMP